MCTAGGAPSAISLLTFRAGPRNRSSVSPGPQDPNSSALAKESVVAARHVHGRRSTFGHLIADVPGVTEEPKLGFSGSPGPKLVGVGQVELDLRIVQEPRVNTALHPVDIELQRVRLMVVLTVDGGLPGG